MTHYTSAPVDNGDDDDDNPHRSILSACHDIHLQFISYHRSSLLLLLLLLFFTLTLVLFLFLSSNSSCIHGTRLHLLSPQFSLTFFFSCINFYFSFFCYSLKLSISADKKRIRKNNRKKLNLLFRV